MHCNLRIPTSQGSASYGQRVLVILSFTKPRRTRKDALICWRNWTRCMPRIQWSRCYVRCGRTVTGFVALSAAKDAQGCFSLLTNLNALQAAHSDEPVLREQWAKSIVNFIFCRAAEDPQRCLDLLTALSGIHSSHPGEPVLRELWAEGVTNFIARRALENLQGCLDLLTALSSLYAYHPDPREHLSSNWPGVS